MGLPNANDSTSGEPVTNFYRSTKLYNMNNGPRNKETGEYDLDRDNDEIVCEKKWACNTTVFVPAVSGASERCLQGR